MGFAGYYASPWVYCPRGYVFALSMRGHVVAGGGARGASRGACGRSSPPTPAWGVRRRRASASGPIRCQTRGAQRRPGYPMPRGSPGRRPQKPSAHMRRPRGRRRCAHARDDAEPRVETRAGRLVRPGPHHRGRALRARAGRPALPCACGPDRAASRPCLGAVARFPWPGGSRRRHPRPLTEAAPADHIRPQTPASSTGACYAPIELDERHRPTRRVDDRRRRSAGRGPLRSVPRLRPPGSLSAGAAHAPSRGAGAERAREADDTNDARARAFRIPSGQAPALTCQAARAIVAQARAQLASAPDPVDAKAFAEAAADWLDP